MKKSKKHIAIYIVLLALISGCGFGKTLTRYSTRSSERSAVVHQTEIHRDESKKVEQAVLFSDSIRKLSRVLIFPSDSFSYSVQDGFKGHAERIEIFDSSNKLSKGTLYESSLQNRISDSNKHLSLESGTVNQTVSKNLKKRNSIGVIVLIAIALFLIWFLCKRLRASGLSGRIRSLFTSA